MSTPAIVKVSKKRTRKPKLATILEEVKPKRTRADNTPTPMRRLQVTDDDTKEQFDIPATFLCSSCHQSHSIAEHLEVLPCSSKVYQTCLGCREKGVVFYRRHVVKKDGDTVQDSGTVRGVVQGAGERDEEKA